MGRYLIRRVLFLILVLFVVSLLTFLIFVKLPAGDPARRAVGGRRRSAEQIEAAREAFGLDKPLYIQYARFAKGFVPWPGIVPERGRLLLLHELRPGEGEDCAAAPGHDDARDGGGGDLAARSASRSASSPG